MDTVAIKSTFETILKNVPGLHQLLLITDDGFPILTTLEAGDKEGLSTAVGAILCDSGQRGIRELALGELEAVITIGSNGYFLLARICGETLFMAVASPDAPLGLLLFRVKRAVPIIRNAL